MELVEIILRDGPDSVPKKPKRTFDDDEVLPAVEQDSRFARALRFIERESAADNLIDDDPDES